MDTIISVIEQERTMNREEQEGQTTSAATSDTSGPQGTRPRAS
jgi:hypothetical protein